jgi:hypothetical protein
VLVNGEMKNEEQDGQAVLYTAHILTDTAEVPDWSIADDSLVRKSWLLVNTFRFCRPCDLFVTQRLSVLNWIPPFQ